MRSGKHSSRQDVASQNTAEDVDQDSFHILVFQNDLKPLLNHFFAGPPSYIEEVRRFGACQFDDVHGGHGKPGAVHHGAYVAVQTNVVDIVLLGLGIQGIFLPGIIQGLHLLLPDQPVVIKGDLAVYGKGLSFFGEDKRIDLREGAVLSHKEPAQRPHERHEFFHGVGTGQGVEGVNEVFGLEGHPADLRINEFFQHQFRRSCSHFFDLHASCLAEDHHRAGF